MNLPVSRPAPYRLFRAKAGTAALILQVRDPETGEAVDPGELEAYITIRKINSPWCAVAFPLRSRLLLTPKTARFLLAAGTVAPLEEPPLIPFRAERISRDTQTAPGTAKSEGDRPPA